MQFLFRCRTRLIGVPKHTGHINLKEEEKRAVKHVISRWADYHRMEVRFVLCGRDVGLNIHICITTDSSMFRPKDCTP